MLTTHMYNKSTVPIIYSIQQLFIALHSLHIASVNLNRRSRRTRMNSLSGVGSTWHPLHVPELTIVGSKSSALPDRSPLYVHTDYYEHTHQNMYYIHNKFTHICFPLRMYKRLAL